MGEGGTSLAARLPALRDAVCRNLIETFARRAAVIGAAVWIPGADMPAITIGQLRLVLRIAAAHGVEIGQERLLEVLVVIGNGLAFRTLARQLLALVPVGGWAVKGASGTQGRAPPGRRRFASYAARSRAALGHGRRGLMPSGPGPGLRGYQRAWRSTMADERETEAYELLLIEEADAWFEYPEATRGQTETRIKKSSRGRGAGTSACVRSTRVARGCGPWPPD